MLLKKILALISNILRKMANFISPQDIAPLPNGLDLDSCTIEENLNENANKPFKAYGFFMRSKDVVVAFYDLLKNLILPFLELLATSCLLTSIPFFIYECIIEHDLYYQCLVHSVIKDINEHWIGVTFIAAIILYRPILLKIESLVELSINGYNARFNNHDRR